MPELPITPQQDLPWKRIWKIAFWIIAFTPVGIWMLWRDQTLTRGMKFRVAIYSVISLVFLSLAFTVYQVRSVQRAIDTASGVDY